MRRRGGFGRRPFMRPRPMWLRGPRLRRPFVGLGCLMPVLLVGFALFVMVFILPHMLR
ncbi:MAG: hypothetical protein KDE59_26935 [Anaerolineales bacterium]|nr:hypothetical protein [Anaerolineales bacterium]MCB0005814.1 hypothetical protein [Anaerolineales bacterium]MCB0011747.1 hypothetical protein [Anaerolineales bacterium]MCB0026796.1 hypothetical protein [Anaerolineales bacterium]